MADHLTQHRSKITTGGDGDAFTLASTSSRLTRVVFGQSVSIDRWRERRTV